MEQDQSFTILDNKLNSFYAYILLDIQMELPK